MRREIEARFEEKLKLKLLDIERLNAEVARLKQAGEQLGVCACMCLRVPCVPGCVSVCVCVSWVCMFVSAICVLVSVSL